MSRWRWLTVDILLAIHEEQLQKHGGGVGVRDMGLLETALAMPMQLTADGDPPPDLAAVAASLAHGVAHLHPFIDGNKRTSLVAAETFVELQSFTLDATDAECVQRWLALAAGELAEAELADWLRSRIRPA